MVKAIYEGDNKELQRQAKEKMCWVVSDIQAEDVIEYIDIARPVQYLEQLPSYSLMVGTTTSLARLSMDSNPRRHPPDVIIVRKI